MTQEIKNNFEERQEVASPKHDIRARHRALYFSRERLLTKQEKIISEWKPGTEIWSLKYGAEILGLLAGGSFAAFTYSFRRAMKLGMLSQSFTYFPGMFVCAATADVSHTIIRNSILLKEEPCPTCVQIRAMSIQSIPGLFQPILLSFIVTNLKARQYATVSMPPILPFGPWYKYMATNFRQMKSLASGVLLVNILMAYAISGAEIIHTDKVWEMFADRS